MNIEENKYFMQMQDELENERMRSGELQRANVSQANMLESEREQNLIQWQLDLKEDLDSIYHLLKGDILGEDKDGNMTYLEAKHPDLKPFNERGVQLIMNIMKFYLNRNTILSNYKEDTINWKVLDFGNEIADLMFNKYEDMMNTLEEPYTDEELKEHLSTKIKLYPMIVKELVDTIHSAYLRAFNGGERESLRTARMVTQNEPLNRGGNSTPAAFQGTRQSSWFKPWTWNGG